MPGFGVVQRPCVRPNRELLHDFISQPIIGVAFPTRKLLRTLVVGDPTLAMKLAEAPSSIKLGAGFCPRYRKRAAGAVHTTCETI